MSISAEVHDIDGKEALSICCGGKCVDLIMPASQENIEIGCEVLMTNLAGVSKAELVIAGMTAILENAHG